ncbi:nuclear transport factor 2 family protein [Kitasatospora sp. NPDC087271]|uniref:nuclear transport factor 2 family protein n=1 Tax=Kitasatospora sp. NPDC087271 TaxID=3364067 RepID=UPI0037F88C0B
MRAAGGPTRSRTTSPSRRAASRARRAPTTVTSSRCGAGPTTPTRTVARPRAADHARRPDQRRPAGRRRGRHPRTPHVTTNLSIEVDEPAGTAVARSYVTALQALPGFPSQPIAAARHHDRFELRRGQWQFAERRVRLTLVGDVSRHLRQAAAPR